MIFLSHAFGHFLYYAMILKNNLNQFDYGLLVELIEICRFFVIVDY